MCTNLYDMTFDIVNFLFGNGDVCHATSHGVYISQLIPFVRASSQKRVRENYQLAFYVNLHRAVIGPSATLTGR